VPAKVRIATDRSSRYRVRQPVDASDPCGWSSRHDVPAHGCTAHGLVRYGIRTVYNISRLNLETVDRDILAAKLSTLLDLAPRRSIRPGQRTTLSREKIIAATIQVADAAGLEAASMRRLAADLGVGTMSLYSFFLDREALLAAVLDRVLVFPDLPQGTNTHWSANLEWVARQVREVCRRHTWVPILLGASPWFLVPSLLAPAELVLASLAPVGVDGRTATAIFRVLTDYVVGACQRDAADARDSAPRETSDDDDPALARYVRQIAADGRYPRVSGVLSQIVDGRDLDAERRFEFGLRCLLNGVAAAIAALPPG
jgi:AcrR family transcriptional regulator